MKTGNHLRVPLFQQYLNIQKVQRIQSQCHTKQDASRNNEGYNTWTCCMYWIGPKLNLCNLCTQQKNPADTQWTVLILSTSTMEIICISNWYRLYLNQWPTAVTPAGLECARPTLLNIIVTKNWERSLLKQMNSINILVLTLHAIEVVIIVQLLDGEYLWCRDF